MIPGLSDIKGGAKNRLFPGFGYCAAQNPRLPAVKRRRMARAYARHTYILCSRPAPYASFTY